MADPIASIQVLDAGARAALQRVPGVLYQHMRRSFELHGQEFDREMQRRMRKGGGGPQRRTGRLARSIGYKLSGDGLRDLALRVFSAGTSYANLQETGGTIRPKAPRQYLTIPMGENLTAGGVPRYPSAAALRQEQPGKTFIFKKSDGRLFIGMRPSKGAKLKVLFVLKKSVEIPPRLGFQETWDRLESSRAQRHGRAIGAAVKEAVSTK